MLIVRDGTMGDGSVENELAEERTFGGYGLVVEQRADPGGRHAPITAADYLQQRIAANFAR